MKKIKKEFLTINQQMNKSDLLFFYFLNMFHENMKLMKNIEQFLNVNKNNGFLDIYLIYFYMVFAIQTNIALKYIGFWCKINKVFEPQHLLYQTISA